MLALVVLLPLKVRVLAFFGRSLSAKSRQELPNERPVDQGQKEDEQADVDFSCGQEVSRLLPELDVNQEERHVGPRQPMGLNFIELDRGLVREVDEASLSVLMLSLLLTSLSVALRSVNLPLVNFRPGCCSPQ